MRHLSPDVHKSNYTEDKPQKLVKSKHGRKGVLNSGLEVEEQGKRGFTAPDSKGTEARICGLSEKQTFPGLIYSCALRALFCKDIS